MTASDKTKDGGSSLRDTHRATETPVVGWQPMETAPKDRPILGWCVHAADPYFIEPEGKDGRARLTLYGGHTEGLSHVSDGPHVIEWGGAWDDRSHEYDGGWMPEWWFRSDSEFEVTANPVLWMDILTPTTAPETVSVGIANGDEPKALPTGDA
jgi:hypothetical protein